MTARKPRFVFLIWVENKNPLAYDTKRLFMGTDACAFDEEYQAQRWVTILQKASDDSNGGLYYTYSQHEVKAL